MAGSIPRKADSLQSFFTRLTAAITSFLSSRRARVALVATALAIVVCATATFQLRLSNSSERDAFKAFFRATIAGGRDQPEYQPTRWGTPLHACIFGNASALSQTRIIRLFSLIGTTTALRVEPTFVEEITACSPLTFLYARIHSGQRSLKFQIVGDVSFIMKRAGMTKPIDTRIDPLGMGIVMIEPRRPPRTYVAAYQFDQAETEYDATLANNVIQQEIVQVLLAARDVPTSSTPRSVIEERPVPDIAPGDLGAEPAYRKAWASLNVPNLCLFDLMLLKVLYSEESYSSNGTLAFYEGYIETHFDILQRQAIEALEDPYYRLLFKKRC